MSHAKAPRMEMLSRRKPGRALVKRGSSSQPKIVPTAISTEAEQGTTELGRFLRARRDLISPQGTAGQRRRVPGLRREEVAIQASVSVDYYTRLEQGRERTPSDLVLVALAQALQLDADGLAYMRALVRPAQSDGPVPPSEQVAPGPLNALASLSDRPAWIKDRFQDVLACTQLSTVLYPGIVEEPNTLRLMLLNPAVRHMYRNWPEVVANSVASLRAAAAADREHPRFRNLVDTLSRESSEFRIHWARHEVVTQRSGIRHLCHPTAGELTLGYQTLPIDDDATHTLVFYYPLSEDADDLQRLGASNPSLHNGALLRLSSEGHLARSNGLRTPDF
jgi:transcriptional regulator with XRE-family HTH domain